MAVSKGTVCALLAQLDRVTGYEPVGRGFESLTAHQEKSIDFVGAFFNEIRLAVREIASL